MSRLDEIKEKYGMGYTMPDEVRYLLHILELLEQDLTYMKQHGELTNIDGKMKSCIDHALLTIHREE
jgi:hypothetical protein